MGQVTHALLTRPPLGIIKSIRRSHQLFLVRLACVKHAASVHPEPGSNSLIKFVRVQENPWLSLSSFYCLFESVLIKNSLEFSRLVVSLFSYQSALFLFPRCERTSISYHFASLMSTGFLNFFRKHFCFRKRRRRDLNPRAALTTYTLSRGASSAT